MQTGDVGVSTDSKGTNDIDGLYKLVVGFHHIEGVVSTSFGCEFFCVDNISTVGREGNSIPYFIRFRTWFRELSSHSAHFDDRYCGSEGHNESHLQNDTESITHVVNVELIEAFSTISSHEKETLSMTGTS